MVMYSLVFYLMRCGFNKMQTSRLLGYLEYPEPLKLPIMPGSPGGAKPPHPVATGMA